MMNTADQNRAAPKRDPRTPARRPRPTPVKRAEAPASVVAAKTIEPVAPIAAPQAAELRKLAFEGLASTGMFETLGSIRALVPVAKDGASPSKNAPAYQKDEIYAVAEMAYHYLRCGGYKLASILFEGLTAIAPNEAYFALALGVCADLQGDEETAARWYTRAQKIDPSDARADLNLAELLLGSGRRREAIALLQSGAKKAQRGTDAALVDKALAMIELCGGLR